MNSPEPGGNVDSPRGFRHARAGRENCRAGTYDLQKLTLAGPVEKLVSTLAAGRGTRSAFGTAPSLERSWSESPM